MNLFDVYPLFDIQPVKAKGCQVWDDQGTEYLDLYGGHAVISIGHSHPHYVKMISDQLDQIGFYSNSVQNPLQQELATKLGELSGYTDYQLFFVNSGAEANENALKLASFHNQRKKVLAFKRGFHGRTSLAVAATDNAKIVAPVNGHEVMWLEFGDIEGVKEVLKKEDVSSVIIEGIQGIGGIRTPEPSFLEALENICKETGTVLILDEIQSGYGRSGKFFAHQYASIKPDMITLAKGMGNGFPIGGVLISPQFQAQYGLLGTTFGGNHLACAAGIAVLDVLKREDLIANAAKVGHHLISALSAIEGIKEVRGSGLMIGIVLDQPVKELRSKLLHVHHIFTGSSSDPHVMRLLPPLSLTINQADAFITAFKEVLKEALIA